MMHSECKVESTAAEYGDRFIKSSYIYSTVEVEEVGRDCQYKATPRQHQLYFEVDKQINKTGLLIVGLCGNNASTLVAGILANKHKLSWRTKTGNKTANFYGSMLLSSTAKLGINKKTNQLVYVPITSLVPFCSPDSFVISGWDLKDQNLFDAMIEAQVLEPQLQDQLCSEMKEMKPLPGVFFPSFIATNQNARVKYFLNGSKQEVFTQVRQQIRDFKSKNNLTKVIVLWSATTERYVDITAKIHNTAENLITAIEKNHDEISPSIIYATAAILEGCDVINGAPQNTFVPGLVELAENHSVFIGGDDFKTGQTKMKSLLVEFLINAGIKPRSIASYNHLGNNDGKNLSSPAQFESKNISKTSIIDSMVENNSILYPTKDTYPDHCVVIKYIPYVGDSKRALDEYTSEIFLNGSNVIVTHNTCEDSLLAAPLMLDLVLLLELFHRVKVRHETTLKYEQFYPILTILSYFLKAPLTPSNTTVTNGLNAQRNCILNILMALIGLPPDSCMELEYKIPYFMKRKM